MMSGVRASIDLGSNSILLLIAEVSNGVFKEIEKDAEVTALGKELDKNKEFIQESMDATFSVLKSYAERCDKHGVKREEIVATATEAARTAKNARAYFDKVEKELGIKVKIITSEAEAYFSSKGILFDTNFESEVITIMDIGGASTELINVNTKNFQILSSISMPIGAVRSTQWLKDSLFVQNLQKVFLDFRMQLDKFQTKELYCVAGTVTSLGNMHLERKEFIEDDVHGLKMKVEDIDKLFKNYASTTPEAFLEEFPFLGKRSQSILGGLHLVYHLIHRLMTKELTISTYGLRYGTILEGSIKEEYLSKNT